MCLSCWPSLTIVNTCSAPPSSLNARCKIVQTKRTGLVIVRGLCLVVASFFFALALQRMPIAETVSIVYLSPIVVVLLARPLLGERIGTVGWIAVVIGFAGVLLIVRPGGGLDPIGVGFVLCNVVVTVAYYMLSRVLCPLPSVRSPAVLHGAGRSDLLRHPPLPWTLS